MDKLYVFISIILITNSCRFANSDTKNTAVPETKVTFETSNNFLQQIYNEAERKAAMNLTQYEEYNVLVEGGGYRYVWLETQPMGGVMYAKRNVNVARDNVLIFLDFQREDGRLPGMITYNVDQYYPGTVNPDSTRINPVYGWFQGYCLPMPAFELYYWLKKDKVYLQKLYTALEKFDNYLWSTRDSDNDGCLESWCVFDTGEDYSTRYGESPYSWPFEVPPSPDFIMNMSKSQVDSSFFSKKQFDFTTNFFVPMESMDIMSYSYTGRHVLSLISKELGNGMEAHWNDQAEKVSTKIREYLWDNEKHACYDRDADNQTIDILVHNNLRCMYYGSFDQQMADDFIRYHLLNPEEFWTPMPLPSIAVNDPYFWNHEKNDWSGQPEALTFQRSIRALENYSHYAEVTILGKKFLKAVGDSLKFTQQFDPFTGIISTSTQRDGYGPSILTSLEYMSRLYGIHLNKERILWSCIEEDHEYNYSQQWGSVIYKLEKKEDLVKAFVNDKNTFSFTPGIRVITDYTGKPVEVVGIETEEISAELIIKGKKYSLNVKPNTVYDVRNNFQVLRSAEFNKPL